LRVDRDARGHAWRRGAPPLGPTAPSSTDRHLPAHGASLAGASVTYTPEADYSGVDLFVLLARDPSGQASRTTLSVSIAAVNDAPTLVTPASIAVDEDATSDPAGFAIGDVDSPLAALVVSASSSDPDLLPPGGIVSAGPRGAHADHAGARPFAPSLSPPRLDGAPRFARAVAVTVAPVNDSPLRLSPR
jgi:hypothetical protein